MSDPVINIGSVANLFVRQMHFKEVGDTEQGHTHAFDHLTLLAKGKIKVTANGEDTEYTAPYMVYIRNDVEHLITALSPDTVAYCVNIIRDETGAILDPEMVPRGVALRELIAGVRT